MPLHRENRGFTFSFLANRENMKSTKTIKNTFYIGNLHGENFTALKIKGFTRVIAGKKEYRENTRNCDNPEIVILKMDYKYSFL